MAVERRADARADLPRAEQALSRMAALTQKFGDGSFEIQGHSCLA